ADLFAQYGGQGGFTVNTANGLVTMNISMTTVNPLTLRTGMLLDLDEFGTFADAELGRVLASGTEYIFAIVGNKIEVTGMGTVSSVNTTFATAPLDYNVSYPWSSLVH